MGRPNFLKTTGMVRSRRERHPAQWEAMAKKMAAVFVKEEDVDATAATIEENMSKWLDETAPSPDAAATTTAAEPQPTAAAPAAADQSGASSEAAVPQRAEYTAEE
eukprot:7385937-Prymnesium_polylepis.1